MKPHSHIVFYRLNAEIWDRSASTLHTAWRRVKKSIAAFLFFSLFATSVFGQGTTIFDSIVSGGIYRKFYLYVPNIYNGASAVPLILNLHGYGSNASEQQAYSNFMPVADTANFLVVHPEGTVNGGNQFWNAGFGPGVDDVQFLSNLIDSLGMAYNINPNHVYSCGMSNGGIMSYYLACNLPGKIAAIASVTGSMLNSWFSCVPGRPFPVMEIHGTGDGTVLYNGDAAFAPIDSIIKKWRIYNVCNPSPVTYSVPDIDNTDNSTAINYKYVNGLGGTSVELYKVISGSHSWPGAYPVFANTNEDFSATKEIWRFFRPYSLNQFVTGLAKSSSILDIQIFPNPAKEKLYFNNSDLKFCRIFSMDGKLLCEKTCSESIELESIAPGIYFLEMHQEGFVTRVKFVKTSE